MTTLQRFKISEQHDKWLLPIMNNGREIGVILADITEASVYIRKIIIQPVKHQLEIKREAVLLLRNMFPEHTLYGQIVCLDEIDFWRQFNPRLTSTAFQLKNGKMAKTKAPIVFAIPAKEQPLITQ